MKDTGLCKDRVYLALRELKDLGLIVTKQDRWEGSQTYKANEYQLIVPTKLCRKKPKKKRSVTVKNGNGHKRDSRGRFRGSVAVKSGTAVAAKNGKAGAVKNGNQHYPSEHYPSEQYPSEKTDSKESRSFRKEGFKEAEELEANAEDRGEAKDSFREGEGDELGTGIKPLKKVPSLSVEVLRELLKGMRSDQLRNYLVNQRNYDPLEVDKALKEADSQAKDAQVSPTRSKGPKSKREGARKKRGPGPDDLVPPPSEGDEEWATK